MRQVARRLKRHFGISARRVTVHSKRSWYSQILVALLLLLCGYVLCYLQFFGHDLPRLMANMSRSQEQNLTLQSRAVQSERQLQIERAAKTNLARELADLQDEALKLKQDVAFYKNILNEKTGAGSVKLHSFKLSKGKAPNKYHYNILLMQSGRPDRPVAGQLVLRLNGLRAGEPVTLTLADANSASSMIRVNFKYYQELNGSFQVPENVVGQSVELSFFVSGFSQAKIMRQMDLPV